MSEIKRIIGELKNIHDGDAWHGPSLTESLKDITPEQAAVKPVKDAHSIWEIVSHIAGWENVFRRSLEGEQEINEPEEGDFPPAKDVSEKAWVQTLSKLNGEHEKPLNVISTLSDSALDELVIGEEYTVRFLLRSVIRHHVYHVGQIGLLRKAVISQ